MKSSSRDWRRVSRETPCPVCERTDWCLLAADGTAAICARVDRGSDRKIGEAGWLHRLRGDPGGHRRPDTTFTVPVVAPGSGDAAMAALAARYRAAAGLERLESFSGGLGVSVAALRRLGVGWCEASRAWSFPMTDASGRVRGIRLRTAAGKKFAVRGGHEGLFVPDGLDAGSLLLVCEGPTDTAALLDLGLEAVGRPSCTGGSGLVADLIARRRPAGVVVVADRDQPGQSGARALALRIAPLCRGLRVVTPPVTVKDAREWKRAGATRAVVLAAVEAAPPFRLGVRTGRPSASADPGRNRHVR